MAGQMDNPLDGRGIRLDEHGSNCLCIACMRIGQRPEKKRSPSQPTTISREEREARKAPRRFNVAIARGEGS